ncbi:leader peptidase (prepilin peptidase)/N-methyltransferase [Mycobacterium sp. BK558]|nr:leader peptidase (prepilin peptidase)/N-methyltransferase [Mycobacterium sp. BK558]
MGETAAVAVAAWLIALSAYDFRRRRLPNRLTVPGAVVILTVAAVAGRGVPATLGALALTGIYAIVHLRSPTALGAGDVKLAIGIGALTGAFGVQAWALCAIGASLLTGLWGAARLARGSRAAVPHGPSMCLAAAVAVAAALPPG